MDAKKRIQTTKNMAQMIWIFMTTSTAVYAYLMLQVGDASLSGEQIVASFQDPKNLVFIFISFLLIAAIVYLIKIFIPKQKDSQKSVAQIIEILNLQYQNNPKISEKIKSEYATEINSYTEADLRQFFYTKNAMIFFIIAIFLAEAIGILGVVAALDSQRFSSGIIFLAASVFMLIWIRLQMSEIFDSKARNLAGRSRTH